MDQVPHFDLSNSRHESYGQQNRPVGSGFSPRNTQIPQWAPTSSQTLAAPYIGARVSLISNSEIRYEGTLVDIDTKESTLSLQNVRTLGTEGRPRNGPQIPPSPELYDYIVFRGSDIKDLQVLEPPLRQNVFQQYPRSLDDPAILSGGSSYTPLGGMGYSGLYDSHSLGGTNFGTNQGIPSVMPQQSFHSHTQQQYPGVFSPFQHGPWGLVPAESSHDPLEAERKVNIPFGSDRQVQGTMPLGAQRLEPAETETSKAPLPAVGAPSKPRGWGPPPTKGLDARQIKESTIQDISQQSRDTERKDSFHKELIESEPSTNNSKAVANGVDSSERSYIRTQHGQNYDRGSYRGRGRPYYRASRGSGSRNRNRVQNSVAVKESRIEEFDVVAMNEKFEKLGQKGNMISKLAFSIVYLLPPTESKEEDRSKLSEMRKLDAETFGRDSLSQRGGGGAWHGSNRYGGRGRPRYYESSNSGYSRPHSSGRVYRIRGSTS
ncbi:uncharacterized protein Gasu_35960 [Galdieria sulphuraria]|uniref:Sm domain-containing protein n=1 Tax=Galdieria sulphuraria TaxID=130081 RepID=M2XG59_GALSU|nr:uncharacterized protein Gasu_35960 [Galdieria sulphuraria]EME29027.1 hypothetical protein Gasu_35960 [Galdieria sulphuraria]|eukprot:XP_005705547.1 hypothetical protein Gasu_35960 [Galdieria sulphuraria]